MRSSDIWWSMCTNMTLMLQNLKILVTQSPPLQIYRGSLGSLPNKQVEEIQLMDVLFVLILHLHSSKSMWRHILQFIADVFGTLLMQYHFYPLLVNRLYKASALFFTLHSTNLLFEESLWKVSCSSTPGQQVPHGFISVWQFIVDIKYFNFWKSVCARLFNVIRERSNNIYLLLCMKFMLQYAHLFPKNNIVPSYT
jgi:hypothetical protein